MINQAHSDTLEMVEQEYYTPKQVVAVLKEHGFGVQAFCSFVEDADNYSSDPDTELYWAVELYRFLGY